MYSKKALIILGGGLDARGNLNKQSKLRYDKALQISQQYDYFICSTGFSYTEKRKPPHTEAELGKKYLVARGINPRKIILEEKSKDTLSNAFYCRKLCLDPLKIKNLAVVTSRFHVRRANFLFDLVFPKKRYTLTFISSPNPTLSPPLLQHIQQREKLILQFYKKHLCTTYGIRRGDLESIEYYLTTAHLATSGKTDTLQRKLTLAIQNIN